MTVDDVCCGGGGGNDGGGGGGGGGNRCGGGGWWGWVGWMVGAAGVVSAGGGLELKASPEDEPPLLEVGAASPPAESAINEQSLSACCWAFLAYVSAPIRKILAYKPNFNKTFQTIYMLYVYIYHIRISNHMIVSWPFVLRHSGCSSSFASCFSKAPTAGCWQLDLAVLTLSKTISILRNLLDAGYLA